MEKKAKLYLAALFQYVFTYGYNYIGSRISTNYKGTHFCTFDTWKVSLYHNKHSKLGFVST